ncbi:MAG: DUF3990 domain-containing protein [Spirochaetales bacterium]|nr:DUF3990 domain-containing protein [Spirochaetales bacterium]
MEKTIYHGSVSVIEKPIFGYGNPRNDYGLGFYCTESSDMAKEWGVSRNRDGYSNCYSIDTSGLSILDLNSRNYNVLHWLSVLLENRTFEISNALALDAKDYLLSAFHVDYSDCDIMVGYRADDSYFSFAQDFINGAISVRQLGSAMKLGNLGTQFVIKSERAFDRLVFKGFEVASRRDWLERKENRDREARRLYFDQERNRRQKGDLYIGQIIDEEIGPEDVRLR